MSKKFSFVKKKKLDIEKSLLSIWFDISCIQAYSKCVKNYYCGHIIQLGCYVFNLRRGQEDSLKMKSEQELRILLRWINQKSQDIWEYSHTNTHTLKSLTAISSKTPPWGLTSLLLKNVCPSGCGQGQEPICITQGPHCVELQRITIYLFTFLKASAPHPGVHKKDTLSSHYILSQVLTSKDD